MRAGGHFRRAARHGISRARRTREIGPLVAALLAISVPATATAQQPSAQSGSSGHEDLAKIGAKLSNPVSDVWALFTEFDVFFSDGDVNRGNSEVGGRMLFQPILPLPLFGSGDAEWKLITRPTIPILFSQPIPTSFNHFKYRGGLGDTQLPMLVSPPTGSWLLGAGPAWLFPTSTNDAFGRQQWGVGPTAVVGYKTEDWIAGAFPQYYFGFADRGDREPGVRDASYLNLLYFAFYNLPDAWQIGTNPTVSFDHRATSGNKWNVPIGITVAKTTRLGDVPVKLQLALEYSVVRQDDFGQQAQIRINVIPVLPSLVQRPLLGR